MFRLFFVFILTSLNATAEVIKCDAALDLVFVREVNTEIVPSLDFQMEAVNTYYLVEKSIANDSNVSSSKILSQSLSDLRSLTERSMKKNFEGKSANSKHSKALLKRMDQLLQTKRFSIFEYYKAFEDYWDLFHDRRTRFFSFEESLNDFNHYGYFPLPLRTDYGPLFQHPDVLTIPELNSLFASGLPPIGVIEKDFENMDPVNFQRHDLGHLDKIPTSLQEVNRLHRLRLNREALANVRDGYGRILLEARSYSPRIQAAVSEYYYLRSHEDNSFLIQRPFEVAERRLSFKFGISVPALSASERLQMTSRLQRVDQLLRVNKSKLADYNQDFVGLSDVLSTLSADEWYQVLTIFIRAK